VNSNGDTVDPVVRGLFDESFTVGCLILRPHRDAFGPDRGGAVPAQRSADCSWLSIMMFINPSEKWLAKWRRHFACKYNAAARYPGNGQIAAM